MGSFIKSTRILRGEGGGERTWRPMLTARVHSIIDQTTNRNCQLKVFFALSFSRRKKLMPPTKAASASLNAPRRSNEKTFRSHCIMGSVHSPKGVQTDASATLVNRETPLCPPRPRMPRRANVHREIRCLSPLSSICTPKRK